jgi:hypothetical protein
LTSDEAAVVLRLGGECAKLVDGGREEGDTCTESSQCDTIRDFECVIKPGGSTGSCQVPEVMGGGERCDGDEVVCEDGFYCDGRNCLAVSLASEPCTSDAMCGSDHTCLIPTDESEGTCEAKLALRDPCTSDYQCESTFCVNGTCRSFVDLSLDTPFCADL